MRCFELCALGILGIRQFKKSMDSTKKVLKQAKEHPKGKDVMFVIHRSSNDNSVVYKGAPDKGVEVFWIM